MVGASADLTPAFIASGTRGKYYAELNGNEVSLYYLPLALVQSLMLFFDVAALPGIIVGLLCTVARE
jgi:hypothetical protein